MNHALIFGVNKTYARQTGSHRIATFLRQHDWDVEVIDYANFWKLTELQALATSRITNDTKFIGFGSMFNTWTDTLEIFCIWLKQTYPWLTLIAGSSTNPSYRTDQIDYYIQGYAEESLMVLLKHLYSNGSRPKFWLEAPGGKKIISANTMYPSYPMRSLNIKYQDRDFLRSSEVLSIETSRGCMFSCAFCNYPVIGVKGDYTRDADDFRDQLVDAYDRYGITGYCIVDETFNDRTEKISKFADVVESLHFEPWFFGCIRTDLMISRPHDREELLRMRVLGHFYGIESLHTPSARAIGKGMDSDRIKEGLLSARKYFETYAPGKYAATVAVMVGLPHETVETWTATKNWIFKNWEGLTATVAPLEISTDAMIKKSKMSLDYSAYGYREMTDDEISSYKVDIKTLPFGDTYNSEYVKPFFWKNEHMDFIQAGILAKDFIAERKQYDFRSDPVAFNINLEGDYSIEETIKFKSTEVPIMQSAQWYIDKKLGL